MMAGMMTNCDELLVVQAKDGKIGEVKAALEQRLSEQKDSFAHYPVMFNDVRLDDAKVVVKGNYAALLIVGVITDEIDAAGEADFTGDVRTVDEYLADEVLAGQPPAVRRFLLQTSICEHVCGELADAITLRTDGRRTLEELERVNDFVVRLGAKPRWFRYHPLFRDVLRHRLLRESPAMVPGLHRRAARWYATQKSTFEALEHAAAAGDWPYVGHLVVTEAAVAKHINGLLVKLDLPPDADDHRRVRAVLAYLRGR